MKDQKRAALLRTLALLPVLLIVYVCQGVVFSRVKLFGVTPLLLPLTVCGAGLFQGRVEGCVMGILAGMLCDLSFNEPTVLFTLLLAFLGLIIGIMAETVLQPGILAYGVVSLSTLLLCAFVQSARLLFIDGADPMLLLDLGLRQTAVSLLFAVPLYFLSRFVGRTD